MRRTARSCASVSADVEPARSSAALRMYSLRDSPRASAAASIRQALLDLAAEGAAIVCISQDLDELMEISDRFAALNEGTLSDIRVAVGLSIEEIGLMMGGAHGMEVAHTHTEGAAS